MPAKKSANNYLPFFGPYSRDHALSKDEVQFLPYKKRDALARLLQAGPMAPVHGVTEDLSGAFPQSTFEPVAASNQPRAQAKAPMGAVRRAWQVANTPVADLVSGEGTTRKFLVGDVDRMMASAQRELDQRAARGEEISYWDALKSVGGLGMGKDAADLVASFSSPLGLATSALGLLGRGAQAAKSLAGGVSQRNLFGRAANLLKRTAPKANEALAHAAPALNRTQQVVGTLLGVPSAYGLATGRPLDTLKSVANVLGGGQSEVSPDQARQDLANASGLAGVVGSLVNPFDFARGRLQNIPGELPAKQRISYSDHDNSLIPMEEAFRRSNSPEFRKHAVEGGEEIAGKYGNRVKDSRTSVSEYEGRPEPSVTTDISSRKRMSGDAAAAAIGKKFKQDSVLRFRPSVMGRQPEYTLTGVKDPVAALQALKKHGVEGVRIEDGNLVFVDVSKKAGKKIRSAASELGAQVGKIRGHANLIEAKDYGRVLQNYEQQRNLLSRPPARTPLYLAGIATSYGAQPIASPANPKRKRR